jgi:NitT/TauT family transport system ATP-binding protein
VRVEVREVRKTFSGKGQEVEALAGVDLVAAEGEFVSIVGPSGCGKSTLLEIVGGLIEPTIGEVLIEGEPINGPHPAVGLVFQQESAFPWRTVLGNVEFGMEMHGVAKGERRERTSLSALWTSRRVSSWATSCCASGPRLRPRRSS